MGTELHFETDQAFPEFRTAVSLHSHTLHSHEPLSFLCRPGRTAGPVSGALKFARRCYPRIDPNRAYWTPPLAPLDAWELERGQIERGLQLHALVSLTDHDSMDAGLTLRVLEQCRDLPVSVEWTVPYRETFFHLGVHNVPAEGARDLMTDLAHFTSNPSPRRLFELLESVERDPSALIVFNHPGWDENRIGREEHRCRAMEFCSEYGRYVHALELNGLRPWSENRDVIRMAESIGKPLISGGDRHGLEPNTILNITNARTFGEFADEVRGGASEVLLRRQYFQPFSTRIFQNIRDIVADHEGHGRGWVRWSDRVFYTCDDGQDRPVPALWGDRAPLGIRIFEFGLRALLHPGLTPLLWSAATSSRTEDGPRSKSS
jgi:hypothetical protein